MKELADRAGNRRLLAGAVNALEAKYAYHVGRWAADGWAYGLTVESFEASLAAHAATASQRARIRSAAYGALGDARFDHGLTDQARQAYEHALSTGSLNARTQGRTLAKLALLALGNTGSRLRRTFSQPSTAAR